LHNDKNFFWRNVDSIYCISYLSAAYNITLLGYRTDLARSDFKTTFTGPWLKQLAHHRNKYLILFMYSTLQASSYLYSS